MQWVIRDISPQISVQESLRETTDRLDGMETVLQSVSQGVIVRDVVGRIVFANDTAAHALSSPFVQLLLGATLAEVQETYTVMDEAGRPISADWLPAISAGRGERRSMPVTVIGFRRLASGQEQWWSTQSNYLYDTHGCIQGLAHYFQDVTAEWCAEHNLRTVTRQLALATERAWQVNAARDSAIQSERSRLASEIHDTLAQSLAAIALHLEAAKDALKVDSPQASTLVTRASTLARECLVEARRSIWGLRPRALESRRLGQALAHLAEDADKDSAARVRFWETGTPCSLPPSVENALLRICQEALTNALRHASAATIRIVLKWTDCCVWLCVADDGRGIDPTGRSEGGCGLIGMRERASIIKGLLRVKSQPGHGTSVLVRAHRANPRQEGGADGRPESHSYTYR